MGSYGGLLNLRIFILFLSTVNALESSLEVDNFGSRKNNLESAVALTQVRNDKAEPVNIVGARKIWEKVEG